MKKIGWRKEWNGHRPKSERLSKDEDVDDLAEQVREGNAIARAALADIPRWMMPISTRETYRLLHGNEEPTETAAKRQQFLAFMPNTSPDLHRRHS
jgi:hypothetical protein